MNNKGFAISIVMYSIVFLIVTILYMLLGIVRNRYLINERLRDQVRVQINTEEVLEGPAETPMGNCLWIEQDGVYFGPEECHTSTIPEDPREGDYQIERLEVKYSYTARYICSHISGGETINNNTSAYVYDTEEDAYTTCEINVPSCDGTLSIECTINTYYRCQTFKYICN